MSPIPPPVDPARVPDYLTPPEAAQYARISPAWLAEKTATGEVPSLSLSRRKRLYRKADLDAWLSAHVDQSTGRQPHAAALGAEPKQGLQ